MLGLPLIRNQKTVDPADPGSPRVFQIETAMGAAIEVFDGATSIVVERRRFLPVKTTDDLLLLRSDAYDLSEDGTLELVAPSQPIVSLDPRFYKTVAGCDARFPAGAPSLRGAAALTVHGDWTFGADVVVTGRAELADSGAPQRSPTAPRSAPEDAAHVRAATRRCSTSRMITRRRGRMITWRRGRVAERLGRRRSRPEGVLTLGPSSRDDARAQPPTGLGVLPRHPQVPARHDHDGRREDTVDERGARADVVGEG